MFEAAIKLLKKNFYHWPAQLTQLIYTDFTVSYRDALDRLRVRLNSRPYHAVSVSLVANLVMRKCIRG